MTAVALIGPGRTPTVVGVATPLTPANACGVAHSVQRLPSDPLGEATLTLVSEVSLAGAEIRIYDMDNLPAGSLGTELYGVESCPGATLGYLYTFGYTANQVWIQIMLPGYEEYGQRLTLPFSNNTLTVFLTPEINN